MSIKDKDIKKWIKPQIQKLSVKKHTLSGSTVNVESNGHPLGTPNKP